MLGRLSAERRLSPTAGRVVASALLFGFIALAALPRFAAPTLRWTTVGAGVLIALGLFVGPAIRVVWRPRAPHALQIVAQGVVYVYWGLHWERVVEQAPLIGAQVLFAYLVEMAITLRRHGSFRLGFGPLPIVGSINLFLWFRDDLFWAQLVMVAVAFASRELLRRDGRHVFNPSALPLALAGLALIVSQQAHRAWGFEIAQTHGNGPDAYVAILAAGLVVQLFFPVLLVTFSAVLTVLAFDALWLAVTGVPHYVDTALPVPVFLGMTLLVTDPATSPASARGKVLFGVAYGLSAFVLYDLLALLGRPPTPGDPGLHVTYFDKLLAVPLLNLAAPALDRLARRLPAPKWPSGPRAARLTQVAVWVPVFFLVRPQLDDHPGRDPGFWETACAENRAACKQLLVVHERRCDWGEPAHCHAAGELYADGRAGTIRPDFALGFHGRACHAGHQPGCDAATELLTDRCERGDAAACGRLGRVREATGQGGGDLVERGCRGGDAASCEQLGWRLLREEPTPSDAEGLVQRACAAGSALSCEHVGVLKRRAGDLSGAAAALRRACDAGRPMACGTLGLMHRFGDGVPADPGRAAALLKRACDGGFEPACRALSP